MTRAYTSLPTPKFFSDGSDLEEDGKGISGQFTRLHGNSRGIVSTKKLKTNFFQYLLNSRNCEIPFTSERAILCRMVLHCMTASQCLVTLFHRNSFLG
jgi:hypothetical protein